MIGRLQNYFVMLENLSNEDLDRSAQTVAEQEKQDTARVIAHIAELDERNYHLELGYRSVFTYCVKRLNLSEGSVYRRLQVARVCRRFPRILEALSEGQLHLTGASLLAPHLTEENVESLIAMARGKSKREIDELLVTLAPKTPFNPSLRKQHACAQEMDVAELTGGLPEATSGPGLESNETGPAGAHVVSPRPVRTRDVLEPATEDRYNFRFSAGREFTEKFKRLGEILGFESPQGCMEEILDQAVEIALEKKDPMRKLERRRQREARKQARSEDTTKPEEEPGDKQPSVAAEPAPTVSASTPTRYIPSEVRERVLERAGYRCEYCGPGAERCTARANLQVEHTKPFAVYHSHDEDDLKVLCAAHNQHAARQFYGEEFMRQKIEEARREQTGQAREAS